MIIMLDSRVRRPGMRALFASIALCVSAASAAAANPKLLMDAQQLMAAGNPKQAYMLLIAEQATQAGDFDYDYTLGVAALDSGKIDESIIAFERALANKPAHPGALMDLARAYFAAGSMDLAEATFVQLRTSNPPPEAKETIERYLKAIAEKRDSGKRRVTAWGELSLGYDTNITGVPKDFTAAVVSAFNIPDVQPTGNAIKRRAPYLGAALGADYIEPLNSNWVAILGGDLMGRAYHQENDFNSWSGELRGGAGWSSGVHALKFTGSYSRFNQEGDAPGDPKPTNDRTTGSVGADYQYAMANQQNVNFGVSGSRVRFLKNEIEDFNATAAWVAWTRTFSGRGSPFLQVSGYYSRDEAINKLADGVTDMSKRIGGVRSYYQYSYSDSLALFNGLGFTLRVDQSPYARATEVEWGRDKLYDFTLGVNWRFQPKCIMRAQWFASQNDSNVAIYAYTRHEISSNIRCNFM